MAGGAGGVLHLGSAPLSLLDFAAVDRGEPVAAGLRATVAVARRAEELGYGRIWYAEHHNMESIASAATAVLIAHVAAHTTRIRLGAGGIMLPNHAPLVVAEQFGTLAELHPGRIDLGLGRAPGTDRATMRALRRDEHSADTFPQDVLELQGYLTGETTIEGVHAIPGRGTDVPLYILGSSLFGAELAATLGLPYGFASHFAPHALHSAVTLYRRLFRPSPHLDRPHVIAGVNVIAADDDATARDQLHRTRRNRLRALLGRGGRTIDDAEADLMLDSPRAMHVDQMLTYTAVGTPGAVRAYLDDFIAHSGADELMVAHAGDTSAARMRSLELLAEVADRPAT